MSHTPVLALEPGANDLRRQRMIRIAVVGAGHWGPNLIRSFDNKRTSEVIWVADRDATRREQVRAHFPQVQLAHEIEPILRDAAVDAVVISTPTSTHYALAMAALAAGKHVLVEKPIATDSRQGRELTELAEDVNRVLMVGHLFLFHEGVRRVKQYIESGDLGRIYYVSMVRTNLGPIRMDVNAAWDLASHDLSIANYWLDSEPSTVSAVGGSWINGGLEDTVFATLRYPGDVLANLHVSWLNPRKSRDITLVGARRMITLDDMNLAEPLRIYDKVVTEVRTPAPFVDSFASFRSSVREGDVIIPKVAAGEPLRAECEHFIDCVARNQRPLTDGRQATAVVRALEALGRSMANGGCEERVER